jgi:AcrR family transcriptional regulator
LTNKRLFPYDAAMPIPVSEPALELATTRDAILDAAERSFAARGFDGVSVREITAAAGLKNQASLYYHFANKQEIYEAALTRGVEAIIARLSSDSAPNRRAHDAAAVANDLDRVLDYLVDHPNIARLIQRAGQDESSFVRGIVARIVEPLYTLGVRMLGEAGGPWSVDQLPHVAAGLYHLIFGYFADASLLEAVLGGDLHSPAALARQRQFLKTAVARLLGVDPQQPATAANTRGAKR